MKKKIHIYELDKLTKSIEELQFFNRTDIYEANIPNGIKIIGNRSFFGCKNLRKVVIPETVEMISTSAFANCENLEEVIILSKNLKKILGRAFAGCKRLKKIVIPEGVELLGEELFSECQNLTDAILPNNINTLGDSLFLNCSKLENVKLPENITSLPDNFFKGCKSLDIKLSDKITSLGKSVFEDCSSLTTYPTQIFKAGESCFKNCKGLENVTLNKDTAFLSYSEFEGCINLKNIDYMGDDKLYIEKATFKNCRSLKNIPKFVIYLTNSAFENCTGLTEIDISNHLDQYKCIPNNCFRGCSNLKKINGLEYVIDIGKYVFAECTSLEEIELPNLFAINSGTFMGCTNLKKVKIKNGLNEIKRNAFKDCTNLNKINIPDTVAIIREFAFSNCKSIKNIRIPQSLVTIERGAFSYMESLEKIEVAKGNNRFITPDNKILIEQMQEKLIMYAIGNKNKSYSLKDYVYNTNLFRNPPVKPISYIGEYAFAGSKYLEELEITTCTGNIEITAFNDCPNLKTLKIKPVPFFTTAYINLRNYGIFWNQSGETNDNKPAIPFENLIFCNGDDGDSTIIQITTGFYEFYNLKNITLPTVGAYKISHLAFWSCKKLDKIYIPSNVTEFDQTVFPTHTKLVFENGLEFEKPIRLDCNEKYGKHYKLYNVDNDTFYIELDGKITAVTKEYIDKMCTHTKELRNYPVLFLDFINDLKSNNLDDPFLFNGILITNISLENRKILIETLKNNNDFLMDILSYSGILDIDDDYTYSLLNEKFSNVLKYAILLKKLNLEEEEILCNRFFMFEYNNNEDMEELLTFDLKLLINILNETKYLKTCNNEYDNLITNTVNNGALLNYVKYVKKYNIKDRYLIDKKLITICDNPLAENLFKYYDANIKRLLKNSKVFDDSNSAKVNTNDLLTLLKITGAFEEGPIVRQRATTFITEKMFDEKLPNGLNNEFRIVGDDIHRIFSFNDLRDEFDYEFTQFFLENYQDIIKEERQKSGFIERAYKSFREISRTSTSNKGQQRHLKVTFEKCKNYLLTSKFDNVSEEIMDFAKLIGSWYDENETWLKAIEIFNESKEAPRNIFTKVSFSEKGEIIYDNNPKNDLKEEINSDFSYEWLPKQDYDNLVLGKYCNCCAHIDGAGAGIMRASMILDCCQNMVIRNSFGRIIAKSTLYVNKNDGYAVFNNVETSMEYRNKESLNKIYKAFLRGTRDFLKVYNENNEDKTITQISIGANRNTILDFLTDDNHPITDVKKALDYGDYSLSDGHYNGDWKSIQRLVMKKK